MARRSKKDPFEFVPKEFKEAVEGAQDEQIRKRIAETAMNDAALADAQKKDLDLQEKKATLKYAMEPYRDGKKANKQKIAYCRLLLEARGKEAGDSGLDDRTGTPPTALEKAADDFLDNAKKLGATKVTVSVGGKETVLS